MNSILVDSSVIVDFLRVKKKESTLLQKLVSQNFKLSASIITHTELFAGKSVWEKKQALDELETLFSGIQILNLDEDLSKKAGEIRAKYELDLFDAIIAATAIFYHLRLATLDIKDFRKIKEIKFMVS